MNSEPGLQDQINNLEQQIVKERNAYKAIPVRSKSYESKLDTLSRIRILEEILQELKLRQEPLQE